MWSIKMKYKFYIKETLKRNVNKVILILIHVTLRELNIKDKLSERFIPHQMKSSSKNIPDT